MDTAKTIADLRAQLAEQDARIEALVYEQRACHADKDALTAKVRALREAAKMVREHAFDCARVYIGREGGVDISKLRECDCGVDALSAALRAFDGE